MQVELTDSATNYLLLHPDARPLLPANGSQPDFAALLALLRHAVAAYEAKTTRYLISKGGKTVAMPCIARWSYDVREMQQFKGDCLLADTRLSHFPELGRVISDTQIQSCCRLWDCGSLQC